MSNKTFTWSAWFVSMVCQHGLSAWFVSTMCQHVLIFSVMSWNTFWSLVSMLMKRQQYAPNWNEYKTVEVSVHSAASRTVSIFTYSHKLETIQSIKHGIPYPLAIKTKILKNHSVQNVFDVFVLLSWPIVHPLIEVSEWNARATNKCDCGSQEWPICALHWILNSSTVFASFHWLFYPLWPTKCSGFFPIEKQYYLIFAEQQ